MSVANPTDHKWTLESYGKFEATFFESFLEQTQLPEDLLRICAEHLKQRHRQEQKKNGVSGKGAANFSESGLPIISNDRLNSMCQKSGFDRRHALLDTIRLERHAINTNARLAKKLVGFFGPDHWMSVLKDGENRWSTTSMVGICPGCGNLVTKTGMGCQRTECSCGCRFFWDHHGFDSEGVAEACGAIVRHRQNGGGGIAGTRRVVSELVFRRRILETAERIVSSTVASSELNKKRRRRGRRGGSRPLLRIEDQQDIVSDVRSEIASRDRFGDRYGDKNPRNAHEESSGTDLSNGESFSSFRSVSFSSDRESCSTSYSYNGWEESSDLWVESSSSSSSFSFSLLSECDILHFLEDSGDTREETKIVSYCTAAKLGNATAAKTPQNTSMEVTATIALAADGFLLVDTSPPKQRSEKTLAKSMVCLTENRKKKPKNEEDHHHDYGDDFILSVYDGAKSCHGGRVSSRFRGDPRQSDRRWDGRRNQRRPNLSRKQGREYQSLT